MQIEQLLLLTLQSKEQDVIKKRKVDEEHRVMQDSWKILYLFDELKGKPTCLICMQNIALVKEYNSKHASKYDKFSGKLREGKLKKLQKSLQNQLSVFTHFHQTGNAVVKASCRIVQQIAMSSKTFSEGSFVKPCMLITAEEICPEKRQNFANISLQEILWWTRFVTYQKMFSNSSTKKLHIL